MGSLNEFVNLIEKLEEHKIYYRLNKIRDNAIMVDVAVPGQRWEIEFNTYGQQSSRVIEIEKFISEGVIYGESELDILFNRFSNSD